MVKINLLPAALVVERKHKAVQLRLLKSATLVAAVLAVGVAALFMLTLQVKRQTAAVTQQRVGLEAEIAAYESAVQLQNSVNSKRELLQSAMGPDFGWRDTLSALGVNIPANVWLTNVAITREAEQGLLTLRGLTYDHPSTANWVSALQAVAGIFDVRLTYSAFEETEEKTLVRFEIRANVGTGELYDPLKRGE